MFPEPPPSYDMAMAALSAQQGSQDGTDAALTHEPSTATQDQTSVTAGEVLSGASNGATAALSAATTTTSTSTTTVLVNTASHSSC